MTVERGDEVGDLASGVNERCPFVFYATFIELDRANLDDGITVFVQAGGFDVEGYISCHGDPFKWQ